MNKRLMDIFMFFVLFIFLVEAALVGYMELVPLWDDRYACVYSGVSFKLIKVK